MHDGPNKKTIKVNQGNSKVMNVIFHSFGLGGSVITAVCAQRSHKHADTLTKMICDLTSLSSTVSLISGAYRIMYPEAPSASLQRALMLLSVTSYSSRSVTVGSATDTHTHTDSFHMFLSEYSQSYYIINISVLLNKHSKYTVIL